MSLFLQRKNSIKNRKKNKNKSLPNQIFIKNPSVDFLVEKEIPRFACGASFTVESAMVIPIVTCFFVTILFFFHLLFVQISVQSALDLSARKLAVYSVTLEQEKEIGRGIGIGLAKASLGKELAKDEKVEKWIKGGKLGIRMAHSSMDGDYLELIAEYDIGVPFRIWNQISIPITQKAKARKWTGWKPKEDTSDTWVYVTENGSVYHTTKDCSHLALSIQRITYLELLKKRSLSGAIYYMCPTCGKGHEKEGDVYITNYGNRYHFDLNCSGIKRTIYAIRKSEVEEKSPCSKCGS